MDALSSLIVSCVSGVFVSFLIMMFFMNLTSIIRWAVSEIIESAEFGTFDIDIDLG